MNILLINANPVVSRLLVLCTRDESLVLHEVTTASEVTLYDYDVIFVDEASYGRDVSDLLAKIDLARINLSQKVFISYRSDDMMGFDITVKKPFLPSQIIDIIQNSLPSQEVPKVPIENTPEIKMSEPVPVNEEDVEAEKSPVIFPLEEEAASPAVLDEDEIEKIKSLLEMGEETTNNDVMLRDDALEARKVELIKEQLIADGLEIVDENEMVEELSISLDGTLEKRSKAQETKKTKAKKTKTKNKKSKSKKVKFTEENMEHIEDAVEIAMASMTKKQMKKLLQGKKIEISVKLQEEA